MNKKEIKNLKIGDKLYSITLAARENNKYQPFIIEHALEEIIESKVINRRGRLTGDIKYHLGGNSLYSEHHLRQMYLSEEEAIEAAIIKQIPEAEDCLRRSKEELTGAQESIKRCEERLKNLIDRNYDTPHKHKVK